MPKIEYIAAVRTKGHPANLIAKKVLKARMESSIGVGSNVAGYIVLDKHGMQVAESVKKSTGEGTMPNTHPDQTCLDEIVKKMLAKGTLTKASGESSRFVFASNYKDQLQEKMASGEISIVFFSERAPCTGSSNCCSNKMKEILGENFLKNNTYYIVEYEKSKGKEKSEAQQELEAQVEEANDYYKMNVGEFHSTHEPISAPESKSPEFDFESEEDSLSDLEAQLDDLEELESEKLSTYEKRKETVSKTFGDDAVLGFEEGESLRRQEYHRIKAGLEKIIESKKAKVTHTSTVSQAEKLASLTTTLASTTPAKPSNLGSTPHPVMFSQGATTHHQPTSRAPELFTVTSINMNERRADEIREDLERAGVRSNLVTTTSTFGDANSYKLEISSYNQSDIDIARDILRDAGLINRPTI